jgi:hypothetical protein
MRDLFEEVMELMRDLFEDVMKLILEVALILIPVFIIAGLIWWGVVTAIRWQDNGHPSRTQRIQLLEKRVDVLNDRIEFLEMKSNQTK